MKINIHIEGATLDEARQLLGGHAATATVEVATPEPVQEQPAPEVEQVQEPVDNGGDEPTLLDKMRADMKETQNVAISDGTRVTVGDEVAASDTGEVAVVLATFRGNLCVETETGDQVKVQAKDLVQVAQEDEPSEAELLGEGTDEAPKVTEADLREAARKVLAKDGSTAVSKVFADVADAKTVSEVTPEMRPAVLQALEAALA